LFYRQLRQENGRKRTKFPETVSAIVRMYRVKRFPFAGVDNMPKVAFAIGERAEVFSVAPNRHARHCAFTTKHAEPLVSFYSFIAAKPEDMGTGFLLI
jgi:hypothetical protein